MTADMQLLGLAGLICILRGLPAAPYEGTMDSHVDLHGQGPPLANLGQEAPAAHGSCQLWAGRGPCCGGVALSLSLRACSPACFSLLWRSWPEGV